MKEILEEEVDNASLSESKSALKMNELDKASHRSHALGDEGNRTIGEAELKPSSRSQVNMDSKVQQYHQSVEKAILQDKKQEAEKSQRF